MKPLFEVLHTKFIEHPFKYDEGYTYTPQEIQDLHTKNRKILENDSVNKARQFPSDKLKSIHSYTTSFGTQMNGKLLNSSTMYHPDKASELDDHIHNIKSHIEKSPPLSEPISTFSGVGQNRGKHLKIGAILHTPAFTSTSTNLAKSRMFSPSIQIHSPEGKADRHHYLHFKLPKGYNKGSYIAPYSNIPGESEYLLAPDQKWKVTGRQSFVKNNSHSKTFHHIWDVEPYDE